MAEHNVDKVTMSTSWLAAVHARCVQYIDRLNARGLTAAKGDVSAFWSDILRHDTSRQNYPDFNAILTMRRGATYPVGDSAPADTELKRAEATAAHWVFTQSLPPGYLERVDEPALGAPLCFAFPEGTFSASGIINAFTAQRIIQWCEQRGLGGSPLRVLEIGAGYGLVASMLLRRLNVRSYTIVDLPENLFLSSFYLPAQFPDLEATFLDSMDSRIGPTGLNFLPPPLLPALTGEFDLVINSYSLQEMTLESVQAYFAFAADHLTKEGLFYSLNSHAKSGVTGPSDYPFEQFELVSFLPVRKFPYHYFFATTPYEAVLAKRTPHTEGDGPACQPSPKRYLDGLGRVIQLGVHDDVIALCTGCVSGTLSDAEQKYLAALSDFFGATTREGKLSAVSDMREQAVAPAVTAYLVGALQFASGDNPAAWTALNSATEGLSPSHARVLAILMLASLAGTGGDSASRVIYLEALDHLFPHLRSEREVLLGDSFLLREMIASYLGLPLPTPIWTAMRRRVAASLGTARRARARSRTPRTAA
jgi:putative sugar O-methyltransferase